MKKMNIKQLLALTGAVLLAGIYVVAFVSALIGGSSAQTIFRAALGATFIVPVLLYLILMVARVLKPRKSAAVDVIVFDLGKVLMDFPWEEYAQEYDTTPEIRRVLTTSVMSSPLWTDLDLSIRPYDDILDDFAAIDPAAGDVIRSFLDGEDKIIKPFWYTEELIKSLRRQGYKIYYLSNWSSEWFRRLEERGDMDYLKLMNGGIFSFDVHLAKPDPAIFRQLFDRYHLEPGRCLFVDDTKENVMQARKMGMSAFVFTDYTDMAERFASMGIRAE